MPSTTVETKRRGKFAVDSNQSRIRMVAELDVTQDQEGLETVRRCLAAIRAAMLPRPAASDERHAQEEGRRMFPAPFTEDGVTDGIETLSIENREKEVRISGHLLCPHGTAGRGNALRLLGVMLTLERSLSATDDLPVAVQPDPSAITTTANPFD